MTDACKPGRPEFILNIDDLPIDDTRITCCLSVTF